MNPHETTQAPCQYLYRVLRRNEDCSRGITAKNPLAQVSVYQHVDKGSYHRSQFISTAASLEKAEIFGRKSKAYREGLAIKIARIDTQLLTDRMTFIDLSDCNVRDHYFPNRDRAYYFARKFDEVLVVGKIPAKCIDNIWTLRLDSNRE
jgi:hypothetical protein